MRLLAILSKTDIELSCGETISTKLLVAADGAISTCCQQIRYYLNEHDFGQVAVIANIVANKNTQGGRAFERFTEHGPVALLPMTNNRLSLVWCLPPEQAEKVMALDETAFLEQLQDAFGWRLGQVGKSRTEGELPADFASSTAEHLSTALRLLAMPHKPYTQLQGQGFNLGIRDVASLAEEVCGQLDDAGPLTQVLNTL